MVMAIVGGAVLPPLMGYISGVTSMAIAMVVPLVGYLYITYYAMSGSKFKINGN